MTREELDHLYKQDPEVLLRLVNELMTRVAALEEKLAPKPHTPSSAQGVLKPMSQRPKSDRKTGGQKGHTGYTLNKVAEPHEVKDHQPKTCPRCGLDLEGIEGQIVEARQVLDLPEVIRLLTVEHRAHQVCCPGCNCQVKAEFPHHVSAPMVYSPHLQTTATLLKMEQAISLERIVAMLTDWFGHAPSEGTIQNWIALAAKRLAPIEAKIKEAIIQAASAGFDETMVRSGKNNAWILERQPASKLHVARTDTFWGREPPSKTVSIKKAFGVSRFSLG